jgi:hypothetical protein
MQRNHSIEQKAAFEGGATRSEKLERYDLIPPEAEDALARRYGMGAKKHGEGNWKQGGVTFIKACVNHAKAHQSHLLATCGESEDDDLGAILCNFGMLTWFRANKGDDYNKALMELKHGQ